MPQTNQDKINLFRSLFRGRTDIYARLWQDGATGKSGYAPVYRLNKQTEPLTDSDIIQHLLGKETIGIYSLLSANTTYFLAVDFDKHTWLQDSVQLVKVAHDNQIHCYLERSKSGNGGHVWFFFETAVAAWKARQIGKLLITKAGLIASRAFDRMFPSQDKHTGKGFGNLIALPLQNRFLQSGNSAFINSKGKPYPNQWQFLSQIRKVNNDQLDSILNQMPTKPPSSTNQEISNTQTVSEEVEETERKVKTSDTPIAKLTLSSQNYIPDLWLPDELYKFLKQKLNFPNPKYYEMERHGYSTWNTPRWIKTLEVNENGILIPVGFLTEIQTFAIDNDLKLEIDDQRIAKKPVSFKTKLKLRPEQQKIARELLKQDRIILEAKPGFGKTMVGLYCMKRIRQSTLIIVHTKTLLHQWQKRIKEWFSLDKQDLGIIGDNKWKIGKKVTIASYLTLNRRGVNEIKNDFGLVIIDECHHVPAKTFTETLKQLPAKHGLGLTATAYRKDKLDRLMNFYIGPTIQANHAPEIKENETAVETKLIIRRSKF